MKTISLSNNSLTLLLECPRCFWLQVVKGIRRPSTPFPSLPLGMDRVLKEHFDSHRRNNTTPEDLSGIQGVRLFPDASRLEEWRDNFKGLRFMHDSGIELMGAIDDLLVTEDGFYVPLDFKTRGEARRDTTHEFYQKQMDIYSFLLEKNNLKSAGFAVLLFYHPKTVTSYRNFEFHAEAIKVKTNPENAERLFHTAIEILKGPEPEKSKTCEFCNWMGKINSHNEQKKLW